MRISSIETIDRRAWTSRDYVIQYQDGFYWCEHRENECLVRVNAAHVVVVCYEPVPADEEGD